MRTYFFYNKKKKKNGDSSTNLHTRHPPTRFTYSTSNRIKKFLSISKTGFFKFNLIKYTEPIFFYIPLVFLFTNLANFPNAPNFLILFFQTNTNSSGKLSFWRTNLLCLRNFRCNWRLIKTRYSEVETRANRPEAQILKALSSRATVSLNA